MHGDRYRDERAHPGSLSERLLLLLLLRVVDRREDVVDAGGDEGERIAIRRGDMDAVEGAAEGACQLRHRAGEHDLVEASLAEVAVRLSLHLEDRGVRLRGLALRRDLD